MFSIRFFGCLSWFILQIMEATSFNSTNVFSWCRMFSPVAFLILPRLYARNSLLKQVISITDLQCEYR